MTDMIIIITVGWQFTLAVNVACSSNSVTDMIIILEWTTSLDTSSRTLFVREGRCLDVHVTSSYVITSDCY